MKYETKKLPLLTMCEDCPFCVATVIHYREPNVLTHACRNPNIAIKYLCKNPLEDLKCRCFPDWCPLEDGEEIDV